MGAGTTNALVLKLMPSQASWSGFRNASVALLAVANL